MTSIHLIFNWDKLSLEVVHLVPNFFCTSKNLHDNEPATQRRDESTLIY